MKRAGWKSGCHLIFAVWVALKLCLASAFSQVPQLSWRIIIANDTCPDVTWGFTESQTRKSFADLIAAHLDEMTRTDGFAPENQDHYNAAAFIEVEAFLEKYPQRQDELFRRIREGRICVSPFLCNSLWGFQSVEGALRTFYPARRMEREHGMPIDVAEHIELPSLPWGMATVMANCGIRWVSVPFLDYDSTFKGLKNPPLFRLEGPDGSEVRVVLDAWASQKAYYMQGGYLLKNPSRVTTEWIPHYSEFGANYPLRTIFASGTHMDTNPDSGKQAHGFAEDIIRYNAAATNGVKLVNGTLAQFCKEVDAVEAATPFLQKLGGSFGDSWEFWPVSLSRTAAALRENERVFLAAESLVALASQAKPNIVDQTRADREKAEWFWAMLSDHAWNGLNLNNKHHNAELRQSWADGFGQVNQQLTRQAWNELGLKPDSHYVTVFNPLSFTNDILVTCKVSEDVNGVRGVMSDLETNEGQRYLIFVASRVPPFGFREFHFDTKGPQIKTASPFTAGTNWLEGPFYRLELDPRTGGLSSLVRKPDGNELVSTTTGRTLGQTVFWDGQEHQIENVSSEIHINPIEARFRIAGNIGTIHVTNGITIYASLDRVDFEMCLDKPPTTNEQRLLHFFPVSDGNRNLHIETTGAVIRPRLQPEGDMLPGSDLSRFAVQGFLDYSPLGQGGVTVAPLDSYMLRLDQGTPAFEALGNDQNWKEVTQDQDGERRFCFRYSLRGHKSGYDNPSVLSWSRSVAAPLILVLGRLPKNWLGQPQLEVDPTRALTTCWKPADNGLPGQTMVRLWETSGQSGPVLLKMRDCRNVTETDLLERERKALTITNGRVSVEVRGNGFAGVKFRN